MLLVDVLNDLRHEDGARLAESFRDAYPQLREVLSSSREGNLPIMYANDHFEDWTADGDAIVDRALAGVCGDLIPPIALRRSDCDRSPRARLKVSIMVGAEPVRDPDYQDSTAA